jgi:hypothetical protein
MCPDHTHGVQATETFKEDCEKHEFPDYEIENVKTLICDDYGCGQVVCVARPEGGVIRCAELRLLPWTYDRRGTLTCASLLFVSIEGVQPILLRLEVDDICEFTTPDPEKWARRIEMMFDLIEVIARNIV